MRKWKRDAQTATQTCVGLDDKFNMYLHKLNYVDDLRVCTQRKEVFKTCVLKYIFILVYNEYYQK